MTRRLRIRRARRLPFAVGAEARVRRRDWRDDHCDDEKCNAQDRLDVDHASLDVACLAKCHGLPDTEGLPVATEFSGVVKVA
jgi:hypothetical protein